MKKHTAGVVAAIFLQISSFAFADGREGKFPVTPDSRLTPGALCDKPDAYRYPEHIPYCNRDVSGGQKNAIIRTYDEKLGYEVGRMDRKDFKIDHYIPLCMGGSNDVSNLWPQHETIYKFTDPLEPALCDKMAAGKVKQAEAVELMRRAKADPKNAHDILEAVLKQ